VCLSGVDGIDPQEIIHIGDSVDENASCADDQWDSLAIEVMHVLTRAHHRDESIDGDVPQVTSGHVLVGFEFSLAGTLCASQQPWKASEKAARMFA
jgi:hypothetical protein